MEKDLLKGNCQKVANHKSNNSLSRQNLCIQCLCYVIVDGFFLFFAGSNRGQMAFQHDQFTHVE